MATKWLNLTDRERFLIVQAIEWTNYQEGKDSEFKAIVGKLQKADKRITIASAPEGKSIT